MHETSPARPLHPGTFFELDLPELRRLKQAGYRRIGLGIALLNSAGEVLVADHRRSSDLQDHTLGLLSETVAFDDPLLRQGAEPAVRTIGRCLWEERGIEPMSVEARTRLDGETFTLIETVRGNTSDSQRRMFGIGVALLLSDAAAEQMVSAGPSAELHGAYFRNISFLLDEDRNLLRPGSHAGIRSLGRAGLLDIANLEEADFRFPADDYQKPVEDIDLTLID